MPEHQQIQQSKKTNTIFQKQATPVIQTPLSNPYSIIQRAKINPRSLTRADVMQLQRTIGNRAVGRLLSSIGNTSTAQQATVQRQEIPEEKGEETCPSCMQRQENPEEKEPLQGKFEDKPEIVCPSCFAAPIVQKQESEEKEKPLQGKMIETIQRQEIPEEKKLLQTKKENNTGMPDNLKAGVENLSGIDMGDVKVHYNSSKPAEVGALAYTQGTDIHVAPGQERHLPHEAWHVVQQKQGRVKPTMQLKGGFPVNDDVRLEHEADVMRERVTTGVFAMAGRAVQHVGEGLQNEKVHLNLPDEHLPLLRPMRLGSGDHAIQRKKHAAMGTMIHHTPPAGDDPVIDDVNKEFYGQRNVLNSRRGHIQEKDKAVYDWDFNHLAQKIATMRTATSVPPNFFPIVINANRMISPGEEKAPKNYMDEKKGVFAISSVWGMNFKKPTDENGTNFEASTDYNDALTAWKKVRDQYLSKRKRRAGSDRKNPAKFRKGEKKSCGVMAGATSTESLSKEDGFVPLDDKAVALLRTHAKDKVSESRNDAIPHRGLRNFFFQDPWFMGKLSDLEAQADFVHIITLDSDTDLGRGEVLAEIADLAEQHIAPGGAGRPTGGLHITATDYVYVRENLFEWLAGALDKVGRKKLEKLGYDAYPAEPGLTISYSSKIGESARSFLSSDPFGPEYSGDPKEGGFKELVPSTQSVEGKNLRERWRRSSFASDPKAQIHRTTAYVNVQESSEQKHGHEPSLKKIMEQYQKKEPITPDMISAMVSSDNYHSLTPGRNEGDKLIHQQKIVKEVTEIFNKLIQRCGYPDDPATLKEPLNDALATYMK